MKKSLLNLAGVVALAFSITNFAVAAPIQGAITFSGSVNMADGANVATNDVTLATQVTSWSSTVVGAVDGNFDTFVNPGDGVTFFAPWSFNSGAIASFWTVGGYTFDLISSAIVLQNFGALVVTGTGTASGHGFDPTVGSWSFTTQNPGAGGPPPSFSFSASSAVPDGGTTALLLGLSLVGLSLAAVRRKSA